MMMSYPAPQALLAAQVPDHHHPMSRAAGQKPSIGTERNTPDFAARFAPDLDAATSCQIPEPDRPIITARGHQSAFWVKSHRLDPFRMTLQGMQTQATADLPDLHQAIVA